MDFILRLLAFAAIIVVVVGIFRLIWTRAYIFPGAVGLVYAKQGFKKELGPGSHRIFDPFSSSQIIHVSKVARALHPRVIDVISRDQFAFRLNLTPIITVTEPREFIENTREAFGYLHDTLGPAGDDSDSRYERLDPILTSAALEAVAAVTLDEFLADQSDILKSISSKVAPVLPGATLDSIALTAINLPPEVRKMFTEVERARREGLAGLERARSEQAALRALANAARTLADNPQLVQLRMLQTMENAKGAKTFVLGEPANNAKPAD